MAAANLDTNKKVGKYNTINVEGGLTAFDGTDGATFTMPRADERVILVLQNTDASNAETVTLKAPANPSKIGGALADVAISVPASKQALVMVESARFCDATTGLVKLTGSADVKGQIYLM